MRREVRVWAAWLVACAPAPQGVVGHVVDVDGPVAGVEVRAADAVTTSDADGAFALDVPDAPPVLVVVGDDAVAGLDCANDVVIDVSAPDPLPTATLALVLREVREDPELHLHAAVDVGTPREPEPVPWDPGPLVWAPDGPRTWTTSLAIPAAGRWSLGISVLRPATFRGDVHHVVTQVVIVGGEGLAPGEVRYVEAPMSGETLRTTVYWDRSGPQGVEEAEFLQQVDVRGVPVEITTWRGPVARPIPVSAAQIIPGDPILGFRGVFTYNPAGACAVRQVGLDAILEETLVPGWLGNPGGDGVAVTATALRLPEPFPSPPMLALDAGVSWSMVPLTPVSLALSLGRDGAVLRGRGDGACTVRSLPVTGDWSAATGWLSWSADGRWGRCDVGGGGA